MVELQANAWFDHCAIRHQKQVPVPCTLSNHRRPTGSDHKRFRQQLEALTSSRMTVNDRTQDQFKGHRFTLADSRQTDLAQHLIQ